MISLEYSEPILASSVSHGDGLPIIIDITVLPYPLPVSGCFLPENRSILLGKS